MKATGLTKVIAFLLIIISVVNIFSLFEYNSSNYSLLETSLGQYANKQLGIDFINASNLLSEQARYYVLDGDKAHYDAYMDEITLTKTRENVIEQLKLQNSPQEEIDLMLEALEYSRELEELDSDAFAAFENGDHELAHSIMFSKQYDEKKQGIVHTLDQYQEKVDRRIESDMFSMSDSFSNALTITIFISIFFSVIITVSVSIIFSFASKEERIRLQNEAKQKEFEDELRKSADVANDALTRLSSIYSAIPDSLFCKDVNGYYTSCNRIFERQAGMPESEIIGKTYSEVFKNAPPERKHAYAEIDRKAVDDLEPSVIVEEVIYPDGTKKILETHKMPLIQDDDVVGLLGIGRDVTSYWSVRERLERIINTAQIAFLLSIDSVIVEANEYSRENLGAVIGEPIMPIYNDLEQRKMLMKMIAGNYTAIDVVKLNMANGDVHRFLVSASTIEYEGNKASILWGIDIEQDEVKNDQIRVMQQSLQTVLDALPIPVRIVDLETNNIVYVNNSFLELLEYDSAEEIYGLKLANIMPEFSSNGTPSSKLINMTLNSEKLISFEVDYETKYGRIIEALLSTRHIEYRGRRSSIGIIKDISAEKEHTKILLNAAEREKEANQAKSLFLANMSHEIRTPMNGIIGFSELALDSNLSRENKDDYLRKIKSSGEGLLQIINDILDISKIEAGKVEIESTPFNLREVFDACETIISPKALEKGITLYCYAEPTIGKSLVGDPTRLQQALLNLLSNAVKFTNVGTVKLLSKLVAETDDTATIQFEVKDSGIGMTSEQIEKVFEAFTQADSTTTRQYGGTGLGLSITKNIIELMGGKLLVESAIGIGSKFSFTITFETTAVVEKAAPLDTVLGTLQKPMFKAEVILFEDNKINQQVVYDHLLRVGINTVIAENGKVGVDIVKKRMASGEKPFDLIFMDIHMPVMDGLEAAQKLSEIGNTSPIVALTANVMNTSKTIYRECGMPDYLAKPFKAQELWACLLKYLTPVNIKTVDLAEESEADKKQRLQVEKNFLADNQNTYQEILSAINRDDIELAHRLAHTLKGTANLINEIELQEAARAVELALTDDGPLPTNEQLEHLQISLSEVLKRLAHIQSKADMIPFEHVNKEMISSLIERLEPLLKNNNTECLDYVEQLSTMEGMEDLVEQIEAFEFEKALEAIVEIKERI